MELSKNQTFVISHEPYIVGVVRRVKCARDNRWVISATDGNEYVYNANTASWSRGSYNFVEFEELTNSNLLNSVDHSLTNSVDLDLMSGQVWIDEEKSRVMIVDMGANGGYIGESAHMAEEHFCFMGIHLDRQLMGEGAVEYYNGCGNALGLISGNHNLVTKFCETIDFNLI